MKAKPFRVIVDLLMFGSMCFLAGTGLLIHYRLVPGFRGGHGLTLLGLSRHEWGTYHLWAAYLLLFLVIVHLVLNFAFIKNVIARRKLWLIIFLGLSGTIITLFFLFMPIEKQSDDGRNHRGSGRQANKELNSDAVNRAR
ncbi:MAG: DUF4405 domain-containing protein [Kiritimatiellia bacterium]